MTRFAELAERYGTPLYVYDLDQVVAARDSLFAALPEGFELFYALKANPHPDVVGVLREGPGRTCRAEISSTGELHAALATGHRAQDCLYTGPGKTDAELDEAIGRGVRLFSVESPSDLRHVGAAAARAGAVAQCLLRVNSPTAHASTGIRMTGRPSQFGIDGETLADVLPELIRAPGTRIVGAHFYTMSNATDEENLLAEYGHVAELAAGLERDLGLPLDLLDLGGGFAAPYAVPGARTPYPKLRAELARILDRSLPRWRSGSPRLACESGRYLVAESGYLVSRVVNIKVGRGSRFVVLDAGINALGGLSGLGRLLPVAVTLDRPEQATEAEQAAEAEQATEPGTLAGPLCTPGDTLGRNVDLPPLHVGDLVTIPNVGAYGLTASLLAFLGRPAPGEVTVRGGEVVSASRLEHRRTYLAAVGR
ncbi:diaminopimelate decarboxylase [Frankia torreyi]|uniref:Diaminopimelate decarboxylase n=1 Tax=Frankia torreyi TaxID=1856 RepID=A0A0D8BAS3_9ACTN|nr:MULTISPECIES: decarboxylase [Frankia]KJE21276.1 diaminopimelate decarboxylase [Frankia torreyi]